MTHILVMALAKTTQCNLAFGWVRDQRDVDHELLPEPLPMPLREPLTTYFCQSVSATMYCGEKNPHCDAESEVMKAEGSWQTFVCASGRRRRANCDIMPALCNVQFYTSVQQEALAKVSQPSSRRLSREC